MLGYIYENVSKTRAISETSEARFFSSKSLESAHHSGPTETEPQLLLLATTTSTSMLEDRSIGMLIIVVVMVFGSFFVLIVK